MLTTSSQACVLYLTMDESSAVGGDVDAPMHLESRFLVHVPGQDNQLHSFRAIGKEETLACLSIGHRKLLHSPATRSNCLHEIP